MRGSGGVRGGSAGVTLRYSQTSKTTAQPGRRANNSPRPPGPLPHRSPPPPPPHSLSPLAIHCFLLPFLPALPPPAPGQQGFHLGSGCGAPQICKDLQNNTTQCKEIQDKIQFLTWVMVVVKHRFVRKCKTKLTRQQAFLDRLSFCSALE